MEAYQRAQVIPSNKIDELLVASANKFLKNLKGVINYGVPHTGSCLESYFNVWHNLFRQVNLAKFMKNLQPSQRKMEDLLVKFDEIVQQNYILVYAFLEGKPLKDLVSNDFLCWFKGKSPIFLNVRIPLLIQFSWA